MTLIQARKALGQLASNLSDDELQRELEISDFIVQLVLEFYPELNCSVK